MFLNFKLGIRKVAENIWLREEESLSKELLASVNINKPPWKKSKSAGGESDIVQLWKPN